MPQQAALVSVLSNAPSISVKKKLQTKKVGQELPSSLLQPLLFPFMQKTDPETTQSLFIPLLLVHAAGRVWVRQGLLCLIETQLPSVGSSLVGRLALEFSSGWRRGSCGFCSLGDELFSRLGHPAHPVGAALRRERIRRAARVCAHPARLFASRALGAPPEPPAPRERRIPHGNAAASLICSKAKVAKSIQRV